MYHTVSKHLFSKATMQRSHKVELSADQTPCTLLHNTAVLVGSSGIQLNKGNQVKHTYNSATVSRVIGYGSVGPAVVTTYPAAALTA